jgi:hypothetical protein
MASVTSPTRPSFNRWKLVDKGDSESERVLRAWAMQHREQEEADAEFEARQFDARNVPALIDSGEWEWLRMERDDNPNARYHDGRAY